MYEETSKITIKKEIIYIYNKIIRQRQATREKTRKRTTSEYEKEN